MSKYIGNIITTNPTEPTENFQDSVAQGVWTLQEQFDYTKAGLWPTAGNQKPFIEDFFSTYLYTGNGSTQTITNGIDLAGEGGLVWIKGRAISNYSSHYLRTFNPDSGKLDSSWNGTQNNFHGSITTLNNGFQLTGESNSVNQSGVPHVSWSFRKAPRFFDVVTYTGTGTSQLIPHNLGVVPGFVVVKKTSSTGYWSAWHNTFTNNEYILLDLPNIAQPSSQVRTVTDTHYLVHGNYSDENQSGQSYVAYLFAHDPLGPSGDGSDGLIACGSFATDGSGNATVDLGWEPQWLLTKKTNNTSDWTILDSMRGFPTFGLDNNKLYPNTSGAEVGGSSFGGSSDASGFKWFNDLSSQNYIYIAIRRGPMRAPTSGTEVFTPVTKSVDNTFTSTGHVVDLLIESKRTSPNTTFQHLTLDRLRGINPLTTFSTDAEKGGIVSPWFSSNIGFNATNFYAPVTSDYLFWAFRRAPEFFDVVAYTGNGTAGHTVPHNLGVAPELIIVKNRSSNIVWVIQANIGAVESYGFFDSGAFFSGSNYAGITAEHIELLSNTSSNGSGSNYIMYLFSTLAGVSKVGFYTGNGSSQTINCGFTTGARFILIKRTDSTGDWYVWDTARGIIAGNDPHLSLNTTAAEVTTDDSIDPASSGFIVNQTGTTNVNVSSASYIFMVIA